MIQPVTPGDRPPPDLPGAQQSPIGQMASSEQPPAESAGGMQMQSMALKLTMAVLKLLDQLAQIVPELGQTVPRIQQELRRAVVTAAGQQPQQPSQGLITDSGPGPQSGGSY